MIATTIVERAARGRSYLVPEAVPRREVAIVPGARVYASGEPCAMLVDRLEAARRLFAGERVRRILVSGAHREPQAMAAWLALCGIPPAAIWIDALGVRTRATMDRAAAVFDVREAVVCTNAFHLARAIYLARRAGIDAVGLAAEPRDDPHALRNAVRERVATWRAVAESLVTRSARVPHR